MTIKINDAALRHARQLIKDSRFARDTRDDWSEHAPDAEQKTHSSTSTATRSTARGIWAKTAKRRLPRRGATAFPSVISAGCIGARFSPSRAGPPRITTTTSPPQRRPSARRTGPRLDLVQFTNSLSAIASRKDPTCTARNARRGCPHRAVSWAPGLPHAPSGGAQPPGAHLFIRGLPNLTGLVI